MGISKTLIVSVEGVIFNLNFDIHSNGTKGPRSHELELDAERILRKYHTKYTPGSFVEFQQLIKN